MCTDNSDIISVKCNLKDYKTEYGYYEIDNTRKFSICVNPHDNCIYGKSAHARWEKIDSDDEKELPAKRKAIARNNVGSEVLLSASGRRKSQKVSCVSLKRSYASITVTMLPIEVMFQQSTYPNENGCVWLSAAMLLNSVNSEVGMKMALCYEEDKDKKQYEWLDIYPNQVRSDNMMTIERGSLLLKLKQLRCDYQVQKIKGRKNGQSLCDFLLKEKKEGLFVVVLEDTVGIQQHAVGIDVGNNMIYDCMEDETLSFTQDNLSICCGRDAVFRSMKVGCELKHIVKRQKKIKHK
jgi:uncharacterized protein Veg